MHVAAAAGRPAERSFAFSVAVELFEPLWNGVSPPAELTGGVAQAAVRLFDSAGQSSALDDGGYAVTRGMWALARGFGEQPAVDDPSRHSASPRGLAVIVDDLHDVDGPTLGLLAYAVDRLASSPVTVIAGRRVDAEPTAPAAMEAITRGAQVIAPGILSAGASAALVAGLLPGASVRFTGACVAACGGNAALLEALVAGLAQRGVSGTDDEVDRIDAVVPDGVASLATERLSRLQVPARALARALAASDPPAALERAAAAIGMSNDAALVAFDALVDADVLVPDPHPAFAQPIMGRAVRASLTLGQQTRLASLTDGGAAAGNDRLGALTPSEDRVAGLAVDGMTTRQIAETLFVTPKTVEFHLRNVYAKLEIPSTRAALARALDVPDR
jgi:DNA-binding CsgD family transcriptional regulator